MLSALLDTDLPPDILRHLDARVRRKAVPVFPRSRERDLRRLIGRRLRLAREALMIRLDPALDRFAPQIATNARRDQDEAQIAGALVSEVDLARDSFARVLRDPELVEILERQALLGERFATDQLARLVGRQERQADLVLMRQKWVRENVQLIKDVDEKYFDEIALTISEGVTKGRSNRDIARGLSEQFGIAQRRAKNIARNEAGNLNSQITQQRQTGVGIVEYIWRTSRDERVRGNPSGRYPDAVPSHWAREGKTFRWDTPPEDGPPGAPNGCRCTAEPVLPDS